MGADTGLVADLHAGQGGFALGARFTCAAGGVVALLGPNGAGKSTLLRALAGLCRADGSARLDGTELLGRPPQQRAVGWVPQDGALFPHLSAAANVAFGVPGRRRAATAARWLERVGMGEYADRRPAQLSGGQRQKVALARALARAPRLLLLDEPLAAVDAAARADLRRVLRRHLREFDGVTLLVTHEPVDALTLADRVLALEDGRVVQDAPTAEVARAPRSPWLARLLGANAFPGRADGATLRLDGGGVLVTADAGDAPPGTRALAVVPAHAVTLHDTEPHGSARNTWPVVVTELVPVGSRVRVAAHGRPDVLAEVTPAAVADLRIVEGRRLWASVKATEVTVVAL